VPRLEVVGRLGPGRRRLLARPLARVSSAASARQPAAQPVELRWLPSRQAEPQQPQHHPRGQPIRRATLRGLWRQRRRRRRLLLREAAAAEVAADGFATGRADVPVNGTIMGDDEALLTAEAAASLESSSGQEAHKCRPGRLLFRLRTMELSTVPLRCACALRKHF